MANKLLIGLLILTFTLAGIYIELGQSNVKIYIQKDYSTFYTKNSNTNVWEISGRETNSLFNGSKKAYRDLNQTYVDYTYDADTNITTIFRHTAFQNGALIVDTYTFRSDVSDISIFPIRHQVEIFNATGLIYQYDVNKLLYSGVTIPSLDGIQSMAFGKNMKVTWNTGNYYSKLYKYAGRDEGKLTIKYKVTEPYVSYDVRLYDPISSIVITSDSGLNNTDANWTASWTQTNTIYNHTFWDKASTSSRVLLDYPFITTFGTTIVNFGSWGTNGTEGGGASSYWTNAETFGSGTGYYQTTFDYINTNRYDNLTRPFTVCAAFKPTTYSSTAANYVLVDKWDAVLSQRGWGLWYAQNSTGTYIKGVSSPDGTGLNYTIFGPIADSLVWWDTCFVLNSSGNFLFVNGTQVATNTVTTGPYASPAQILIGAFSTNGTQGSSANATFNNVMIYNWSLSGTQIAERYDSLLDRRPIRLMSSETEISDAWTAYVVGGNTTTYSYDSTIQTIGEETGGVYDGKYYFSWSTGDDSNDCYTEDAACKSIDKLNSLVLVAGDIVYFKCGDIWRIVPGINDYIDANESGSSTTGDVTWTRYGTCTGSNNPSFYGSMNASTTGNWTSLGSNIWRWSVTTNETYTVGNIVSNDVEVGIWSDTYAGLNAQGEFFSNISSNRTYMYSTVNPATYYGNLEMSLGSVTYDELMKIRGHWQTIRYLDFRNAGNGLILSYYNKGVHIVNSSFKNSGGIVEVGGYDVRYGGCISFECNSSHQEVAYNTFDGCWDNGIGAEAPTWCVGGYGNQSDFNFHHNVITNSGVGIGFINSNYTNGIVNSILVHHNTIVYAGWGWTQQRPNKGIGILFASAPNNVEDYNFTDNIIYWPDHEWVNLGWDTTTRYQGDEFPYFNYNLYYESNHTNVMGWNNTNYTSLATFQAGTSQEANGAETNPLFTSVSTGDYTPLVTSPACDMSSTGSYVGALTCAMAEALTITNMLISSDSGLNNTNTTWTVSWTDTGAISDFVFWEKV